MFILNIWDFILYYLNTHTQFDHIDKKQEYNLRKIPVHHMTFYLII